MDIVPYSAINPGRNVIRQPLGGAYPERPTPKQKEKWFSKAIKSLLQVPENEIDGVQGSPQRTKTISPSFERTSAEVCTN
jgi:hypothetical protein